jgi:hypothetical protein
VVLSIGGASSPGLGISPRTIAAGQVLDVGTVLSWISGPGPIKYRQLNPAASDGSQIARAVLYDKVDTTAGEAQQVVLHSDCEVKKAELVWPEGITDNQRADAIEELAARGIIVR